MARGLNRRLIERTRALAERTGGFSRRVLQAALDSSPLWGVGQVEDTYNLLGHALRKALRVMARQQGRGLAELAGEDGAELIARPSLKAALDLDWDDPAERQRALERVLSTLEAVKRWMVESPEGGAVPPVSASLAAARQVQAQEVAWTEKISAKPIL